MGFVKGVDISMLDELEQSGVQYYDCGESCNLFQILGSYDINLVRLRIWNNPYDGKGSPYGGGNNDYDTTVRLARRAKVHHMDFMLDIHYSDFWADPSKQFKPKSWEKLNGCELREQVYQYTYDLVSNLISDGVKPDMVQIGNELTNGILWPDGKLPNYREMCELLKHGVRAVREIDKKIQIILHLDYGGNNHLYRSWFDKVTEYGVDFDIIGLSYYPSMHGTLDELIDNMNDISVRYSKDTLVVETAFAYTFETSGEKKMIFSEESAKGIKYPVSPKGQAEFLDDLMSRVRSVHDGRGLGIIYWEPGWLIKPKTSWTTKEGSEYVNSKEEEGGNHWSNQALFDFDGNALPALQVFKNN